MWRNHEQKTMHGNTRIFKSTLSRKNLRASRAIFLESARTRSRYGILLILSHELGHGFQAGLQPPSKCPGLGFAHGNILTKCCLHRVRGGGGPKCQAWLHWGSRRPTSAQNRVGRPQQVSKNANNDVIMEMSQVASCC